MHLQRYHQWIATAPAQARAEAAVALVAAYGHVGHDRERVDRLDRMMAVLLEDPSMTVRRALAEAAARSVDVPRCVIVALAQDDAPVAVPVLVASPLLSEADLVEAVAAGDGEAQVAVATRAGLPEGAAAAVVAAGHREAILALCNNETASIAAATLRRILQRYGDDGAVREALLPHALRDPALHHELLVAGADALTQFAVDCSWMSPARADAVRRESQDKGTVTIAAGARSALGPDGPRALVAHLRAHNRLTPALLLRAILSGNLDLVEAALSQLAGMTPARAAGQLRTPMGLGFASLYAKAGMPAALLPVFRAALQAVSPSGRPALSRAAIARVMAVCLHNGAPELERVMALLRKLEGEALRDDARLPVRDEPEPPRHPGAPNLAVLRAAQPPGRLSFRAAA